MTVKSMLAALAVGAAMTCGAGAAQAANVYLYGDPAVVDTAANASGEFHNLRLMLQSQGHTVTVFTGATTATWGPALTAADMVIIPEPETGNLAAYVDAGVEAAIRGYVNAGRSLQFVTDYSNSANAIFSFSVGRTGMGTATLNAVNAAGTAFAGGPATIPANNGSGGVATASLPVGSLCMYDSGGNCAVAVIPYGAGRVIHTSWDYFDAAPAGSQDGGWVAVQGRIVAQYSVIPATVPTLTEWAMILFGLVLAGFAVLTLQRRRQEA